MADNEIRGKIKSFFTTAANRDNLTSGEELQTSLGKIKKWFSDLKNVAFTGSYNDLSNTPTIPSTAADVGALPNNATVSITGAANGSGTFSNGAASVAVRRRACNVGNITSTATTDTPWYIVADYTVPDSNNNFNRITFLVQTGYSNTDNRMNGVGILDVVARINVNGTVNYLKANWILSGHSIGTDDFVLIYDSTSRKISLYAKRTESYSTYRFIVLAESSNYNNVDIAELWTLYNTRTGIAALPTGENVTTVTSTLAMLEAGTVYMNSPAIDRTDAAPETEQVGTGRIIFRDKNNKQIGIINPSRLTDGRERLYIAVNSEKNNSMITNYLILDIAPDGTCSYRVSDPAAFRTAISAASSAQMEQALDYGGYNLLPLDNITADSGIVYTVDKNAGTITVTSKGSSSAPQIKIPIPSELVGNYYFAVVGSSSTADAYVWCTNDSARAKKWDGTTGSEADVGGGDCEIQLVSSKSYNLNIRLRDTISGSLVLKPMVYSDKLKGIPFQPYAMSNLELTQKKAASTDLASHVDSISKHIPFVVGTGTTAGTWTGTLTGLTAYYDGLLILYKSPVAGGSSETTLNINSLGAKTVYMYNTTKLTTHYPANQPILLVYSESQNSGCWVVADGYDANTVPSAYCGTSASTAAKTATCTNYKLLADSYILVSVVNANSASDALTLNINSRGAKPIYINGTASSSTNNTLPAGTYLVFYDGTNYYFRTDGKITGNGWTDNTGYSYIDSDGAGNVKARFGVPRATEDGIDLSIDIYRDSEDPSSAFFRSMLWKMFTENGSRKYGLIKMDYGNLGNQANIQTNADLRINALGSTPEVKFDFRNLLRFAVESEQLRWTAASGALPTGSGTNLVIDSDGYIMKSSSSRDAKHSIDYVNDTEQFHDALMLMRPATFVYNSDNSETEKLGMIAEDVADVCPIAGIVDKNGKVENYDDRAVIAMLVMEVQRLNKEIQKLKKEENQNE